MDLDNNKIRFYWAVGRMYRCSVGNKHRDISVGMDGKVVAPLYEGDRLTENELEEFYKFYKKNKLK